MKRRSIGSLRFFREERAAGMIEFVIILPLLLLLVGGIIDFGRIFFEINALTNVAREGARTGAVTADLSNASLQAIRDTVIARFNRNSMKSSTLTAARVTVDAPGTAPNVTVRVRIRGYQLNPLFLGAVVKDSITEVKAEFRHEFQ